MTRTATATRNVRVTRLTAPSGVESTSMSRATSDPVRVGQDKHRTPSHRSRSPDRDDRHPAPTPALGARSRTPPAAATAARAVRQIASDSHAPGVAVAPSVSARARAARSMVTMVRATITASQASGGPAPDGEAGDAQRTPIASRSGGRRRGDPLPPPACHAAIRATARTSVATTAASAEPRAPVPPSSIDAADRDPALRRWRGPRARCGTATRTDRTAGGDGSRRSSRTGRGPAPISAFVAPALTRSMTCSSRSEGRRFARARRPCRAAAVNTVPPAATVRIACDDHVETSAALSRKPAAPRSMAARISDGWSKPDRSRTAGGVVAHRGAGHGSPRGCCSPSACPSSWTSHTRTSTVGRESEGLVHGRGRADELEIVGVDGRRAATAATIEG